MIQATELRIGNLIERKDIANGGPRIETIIELRDIVLTSGPLKVFCGYDEINPIPLTEGWHNKFGVRKDGFHAFVYELAERKQVIFTGDYVYLKDVSRIDGTPSTADDLCLLWNKDIKKRDMYVHEWMNLFFALTGTELTAN